MNVICCIRPHSYQLASRSDSKVSALSPDVILQRTYSCILGALVIEIPCVACSYSQRFMLTTLFYFVHDEPDVSVGLKKS